MDLIDATAPADYLRDEWKAFILAAEKLVGDKGILLMMQMGEPPTNETERRAFELWTAGLKVLGILHERGESWNTPEEEAQKKGK